ncbi:MAG: MFS transporter [Planctomycetota bacterium]
MPWPLRHRLPALLPTLRPELRPFITSQVLTTLGDSCFHITLSVCALSLSGDSLSSVGITWLIRTLPYFVAMPLTGWIVDRFRRRAVMRFADLLRSLILALLCLGLWEGGLSIKMFWVLTFLKSLGDLLFSSARDAWITQVPGEDNRVRINAIVMGGYSAGFAGGILIAGALLALGAGPSELVGLNALTYALSLCILGRTLNPPLPTHTEKITMLGLRQWKILCSRHPGLADVLALAAVNNFLVMGPALVSAPILIRRDMGLPWECFAWYEVAVALGALLASWMMSSRMPLNLLRLFTLGIIFDGLTFVPYVLAKDASWYAALLAMGFVHALIVPVLMIARTTWIQSVISPSLQGRVFAVLSTMVLGFMGLGCLATSLALEYGLSTPDTFYLGGLLTALTGLVGCWRFRTNGVARWL